MRAKPHKRPTRSPVRFLEGLRKEVSHTTDRERRLLKRQQHKDEEEEEQRRREESVEEEEEEGEQCYTVRGGRDKGKWRKVETVILASVERRREATTESETRARRRRKKKKKSSSESSQIQKRDPVLVVEERPQRHSPEQDEGRSPEEQQQERQPMDLSQSNGGGETPPWATTLAELKDLAEERRLQEERETTDVLGAMTVLVEGIGGEEEEAAAPLMERSEELPGLLTSLPATSLLVCATSESQQDPESQGAASARIPERRRTGTRGEAAEARVWERRGATVKHEGGHRW